MEKIKTTELTKLKVGSSKRFLKLTSFTQTNKKKREKGIKIRDESKNITINLQEIKKDCKRIL